MKPILYIFSGVPGSGKTTIAKEIVKKIGAAYCRPDTIEQGLRDICSYTLSGGEGYRLTHRIVEDNLRLGVSVIVDCCNPWELTRTEWQDVAINAGCIFLTLKLSAVTAKNIVVALKHANQIYKDSHFLIGMILLVANIINGTETLFRLIPIIAQLTPASNSC